jgi:hypothetical protein
MNSLGNSNLAVWLKKSLLRRMNLSKKSRVNISNNRFKISNTYLSQISFSFKMKGEKITIYLRKEAASYCRSKAKSQN